MSTPEMNIPLPFGVVATPSPTPNVLEPQYTELPEGVSAVQVTWAESSRLRITLSTARSHASRVDIGEVPAGSGRRGVVLTGVGAPAGENRYLSLIVDGVTPEDAEATVQVVTMPLQE